jgi:hypothetical protein
MDGEEYFDGGADSGDLYEGYGSTYDGDEGDLEPSFGGSAAAAAAASVSLSGPRAVPTTAKLLDEAVRAGAPVREVCACGQEEALVLMAAFGWDPRRVEDQIFADGARERAGIAAVGTDGEEPPLPDGASPADTFTDPTTLEDVAYADADACARGHWFSATAWREHLQAAADAAPGAALLTTRCPLYCPAQPECNEVVRPRLFRKFCSPELYARLCDFAGREWAQRSPDPRVRPCPAPGCT